MLFNSYVFILCFLPLSVFGYLTLNHFGRHKAALLQLTIFSFIFYAYDNIRYLPVLAGSIGINWLIACLINRNADRCRKKFILIFGILLNIASIFYFKYYDFFLANCNRLFRTDIPLRNILLPLGISFFTFQQISYLVDTYRGETGDYTFIEYAAFVAFFPQLVAGPIVLHSEIIPQFREKEKWHFSQDSLANGIHIFVVGLFKKVIVADTFGNAVSWGWGALEQLSSLELILIMLFYTLQIYFDFSGYSDMAIGIAKMFRIDLPVNFNSPYKALSIIDFWKRWHMTLTRFLRNYIYIPLGGSRKGERRTCINILLVFLISGIWHGASWTFILWGVVHGIAQVLNRIFQKTWDRLHRIVRWLCTFLFVNFAWVLFRSNGVQQAIFIFRRIFALDSFTVSEELTEHFALPEAEAIVQCIAPLARLRYSVTGFYMWIFLFGALWACIGFRNLQERSFRPTAAGAVFTAVLLIWSVVSFAGVSTFLYFNF